MTKEPPPLDPVVLTRHTADPGLVEAIAAAAGVTTARGLDLPIYESELTSVIRVDAGHRDIKSLTGLEKAESLRWLCLAGNQLQGDDLMLDVVRHLNLDYLSLALNNIALLKPELLQARYGLDLDQQMLPVRSIPAVGNSPCISQDGRVVAFQSTMADFVPGYANEKQDIIWYDQREGEVKHASMSIDNWNDLSMSADGPYQGQYHVYLCDLETGEIYLVSMARDGKDSPTCPPTTADPSYIDRSCTVSEEGRFVVFDSSARDLVSTATAGTKMYLRDMHNPASEPVLVAPQFKDDSSSCTDPAISGDGR